MSFWHRELSLPFKCLTSSYVFILWRYQCLWGKNCGIAAKSFLLRSFVNFKRPMTWLEYAYLLSYCQLIDFIIVSDKISMHSSEQTASSVVSVPLVDMLYLSPVQELEGVVPDVITFNTGISVFMRLNLRDKAFQLLDEMARRNIHPRVDTFNSILTGLLKVMGHHHVSPVIEAIGSAVVGFKCTVWEHLVIVMPTESAGGFYASPNRGLWCEYRKTLA